MTAAVHRLHLASVQAEGNWTEIYGYLVVTPGRVVLVDTGVGDDSPLIERLFRPRRRPIADLLAAHGLRTSDVSTVINSHLHYDHCGNNRLFPNAEIVVQSRELKAARIANYTVTAWFDYEGARLRAVSGDAEILPGVQVVASHGHTPGHQSVLVEADTGTTLVAAQAAFCAAEYEAGGDVSQAHEGLESAYIETIARLRSLKARQVYFSHDHRTVDQT